MIRARLLATFGLVVALAAPAAAAEKAPEGLWKLTYAPSGYSESTNWIIKVEMKDGKATGTLAASNPRMANTSLDSFTIEGKKVRAVVKIATGEQVFEGHISDKDGKKILGSFGDDRRLYPAWLAATDQDKLEARDGAAPAEVAPMQKALQLLNKPQMLRIQAGREKDADQKAKLLEQVKDAEKEADAEAPKLFQEVVEKHGDTCSVFDAALNLVRGARKTKPAADKVKGWAATAAKTAEAYGPRWQQEYVTQLADALVRADGLAPVALEYAAQAEKGLDAKAPLAKQARVLKVLAVAQERSGKAVEAKQTEAKLVKVEEALDKEYHATVPPFKGQKFAGRKGKSDRAVVMELFTGAQCPPCVAADVAFDVLEKSYKPTELILIQYHMHIPGPDPLTNADCEARWDYYRKAFEEDVGGTPTAVFNGKPQPRKEGGGGPMAFAERKYQQYRETIDPLLETEAGAKLLASATRKGDQIDIKVQVSDLASPGGDVKLRLVLVEDSIRYLGSNNIRFHHQVVRALPGGAEGKALTEKDSKHAATVDLKEVRKQLTSYLDDYDLNKRPFPYLDRPMDLKNLRVIALVQDDKTHEIVQAVQVDVLGN